MARALPGGLKSQVLGIYFVAMTQRPEESESFIRFIQVAREDPAFADFLRKIGATPLATRKGALDRIAEKMRATGARADLIEVVEYLVDSKVMDAVLKLLDEPGPGR